MLIWRINSDYTIIGKWFLKNIIQKIVSKKTQVSSQKIGLDIGLVIGRFFMGSEDLHYGYWPNGKDASVQNFAHAQDSHSKLIMDHIPEKTNSILDVGGGSGNLALKLLDNGYSVDCVIPSEFLAEQAKAKLGNESVIHICGFEQIPTTKTYDLIIFSESFQYVKMDESLHKVGDIISSVGHLLICDFFRRDVPGKSPMGGGHSWQGFKDTISTLPFQQVTDLDISEETAPTIDLLDQFCQDVLMPISEMSGSYLQYKYPYLTKLLNWKLKKRIEKIRRTYLSGELNGDSFKKFKTYRLLLYKRKS